MTSIQRNDDDPVKKLHDLYSQYQSNTKGPTSQKTNQVFLLSSIGKDSALLYKPKTFLQRIMLYLGLSSYTYDFDMNAQKIKKLFEDASQKPDLKAAEIDELKDFMREHNEMAKHIAKQKYGPGWISRLFGNKESTKEELQHIQDWSVPENQFVYWPKKTVVQDKPPLGIKTSTEHEELLDYFKTVGEGFRFPKIPVKFVCTITEGDVKELKEKKERIEQYRTFLNHLNGLRSIGGLDVPPELRKSVSDMIKSREEYPTYANLDAVGNASPVIKKHTYLQNDFDDLRSSQIGTLISLIHQSDIQMLDRLEQAFQKPIFQELYGDLGFQDTIQKAIQERRST